MPTTTAETSVQRLREERERAQISQTQLAHRVEQLLGVAIYPTTITKMEKRERAVKLNEAIAITQVLNLPLGSLVCRNGAVAAKVAELQQEVERQQSRADAATAEYQQAQLAIAELQREIEHLDASGGD